MGFATALSGLAAAATNLQVVGNNIANANTVGFKESRAEFADVYNSTGKTTPGSGVRVSEVAQQFAQGNVESTQNNLDLALNGNGFFALGETFDSTSATAYTRNGAFHLSPEGYITNDTGHFLMGGAPIGTTVEEGFSTGAPQAIRIDTAQGAPSATTSVDLTVNLDSREGRPATAFTGYDPLTSTGPDVTSYNSSTSATIFDSLGNTHTLSTYFVDETPDGAATSTWASYVYLDGRGINTGSPATLDSPDGTISTSVQGLATSDATTATAIALTNEAKAIETSIAAFNNAVTALDTELGQTTPDALTVATLLQNAKDAGAATKLLTDAADTSSDGTTSEVISASIAGNIDDAILDLSDAETDIGTSSYALAKAHTVLTLADITTATTDNTNTFIPLATTAEIDAALAAIPGVSGVTTQQTAAATAESTATSATASTVLAAAAYAELTGTKIPMTFDSLGNLTAEGTGTTTTTGNTDDNFQFSNIDIAPLLALNVSAEALTISFNPTGSTQYAADFGVNDLQQNGFASGNLTGVSVDKTGVVLARYSNGTTSPLGQVILGRFTNNQGLGKIGDTTWQESIDSGTVVLGVAGGNNFGDITSSALENSNTDIATQLVKMIVAQQAYQANAQTISTEDEIIQRILQL